MHVLMYVMTMLFLMSIITYTRLETFLSYAGIQSAFTQYMEKTERRSLIIAAEKWYDNLHPTSYEFQKKNPPNPASPRLSIFLLLHPELQAQNGEIYRETRELLKQLIISLYGNQPFFQEMQLRRSNFLNEMLDEIVRAVSLLPEGRKITRASELSTLELHDPDLHYVFYLMLQGLVKPEPLPSETPSEEVIIDTDDVESSTESEEAHADAGYLSLLDFITARSANKLRVFLASPSLLMSIFQDQVLVDYILNERYTLYLQVKRGALDSKEASEVFDREFSQRGNASTYAAILDFSVTKTNPKKYE